MDRQRRLFRAKGVGGKDTKLCICWITTAELLKICVREFSISGDSCRPRLLVNARTHLPLP